MVGIDIVLLPSVYKRIIQAYSKKKMREGRPEPTVRDKISVTGNKKSDKNITDFMREKLLSGNNATAVHDVWWVHRR